MRFLAITISLYKYFYMMQDKQYVKHFALVAAKFLVL